MALVKLNADVAPTEENATAIDTENIFATLTNGLQGIIDLILSIVEMIRSAVENITGKK